MAFSRQYVLVAAVLCFIWAGAAAAAEPGETEIGGYGEMHFNNPQGGPDTLDFHRFVLFLDHGFTDDISFKAEVELEHAFVQDGEGELELEQAYVDFKIMSAFNVKVGVLLVPMGIINLLHEPPSFNSVERPLVDSHIIPATWFEAGMAAYGVLSADWSYELGVYGGLDAMGFAGKEGIRGGRQKAYKTAVEDLGFAGRLEYAGLPGLVAGLSFYTGSANQTTTGIGSASVTGLALHADYNAETLGLANLDLRFEFAQFSIGDADLISAATTENVAEVIQGFYLEAAYDLMPHLASGREDSLTPFVRYEVVDTQASMASGQSAIDEYTRSLLVFGIAYRPTPNVVVKVNYTDAENEDSAVDAVDTFDMGIGYAF